MLRILGQRLLCAQRPHSSLAVPRPTHNAVRVDEVEAANGGSVSELGNRVALVVEAEDVPVFAADYEEVGVSRSVELEGEDF